MLYVLRKITLYDLLRRNYCKIRSYFPVLESEYGRQFSTTTKAVNIVICCHTKSELRKKSVWNYVRNDQLRNQFFFPQNYEYSVDPILQFLHDLIDYYNEVLMQRWVKVFQEILEEESFLPIQVGSRLGVHTLAYITFFFNHTSIFSRLPIRKNMKR